MLNIYVGIVALVLSLPCAQSMVDRWPLCG